MNRTSDTINYSTPLWELWFTGGMFLNLTAFLTNIIMIITIVTSADLWKLTCNKLLLNLAICDCIATVGVIHSLSNGFQPIFRSLNTTIRVSDCFQQLGYGILVIPTASMGVLAIEIDRLIAIYCPHKYVHLHGSYVVASITSSWITGSAMASVAYLTTSHTETTPICVIGSTLSTLGMNIANKLILTINVMVILANGTMLFKLYQRAYPGSPDNTMNPTTKRIITTIVIISTVYICTWVAVMMVILLSTSLNMSKRDQFSINLWLAWPTTINQGSNWFIYMARSSDYRKATAKLFKWRIVNRSPNSRVLREIRDNYECEHNQQATVL